MATATIRVRVRVSVRVGARVTVTGSNGVRLTLVDGRWNSRFSGGQVEQQVWG